MTTSQRSRPSSKMPKCQEKMSVISWTTTLNDTSCFLSPDGLSSAAILEKNILLTTPLLQWYLEHGLVVDDIQQVIEYQPQRCFKAFGETVSDARRQVDLDPFKAILADTFKLLGILPMARPLQTLLNILTCLTLTRKGPRSLSMTLCFES